MKMLIFGHCVMKKRFSLPLPLNDRKAGKGGLKVSER